MCGIAAILTSHGEEHALSSSIDKMTKAMSYRGPDATGQYVDQSLGALGHTRLSIIDTRDVSNQPFAFSPKLIVSFNGEIFNYIELRAELEKNHHIQFRTKSDTEVLLAAYHIWGDDCVKRFNGMWAFVIFDLAKQRAFCSRDRFGIKPFLYALNTNEILIASEAKAILKASSNHARPNFTSLSLLLRSSVGGQNEETCFEGIKRLPPAHNLIWEDGRPSISRYWDYPQSDPEADKYSTFDDAACELSRLIDSSVAYRLRSDVPVGFTVSGGIDSCGILAFAQKHLHENSIAYTATYRSNKYRDDESAIARKVVASVGIEHRQVPIEKTDLLDVIRKLAFHLEAPHTSFPMIAYWKIMEEAKSEIKVMLEGQGADELFGGYTDSIAWPAIKDDLRNLKAHEALFKLWHGARGDFGLAGHRWLGMLVRTMFPWTHEIFRRMRGDEFVYQLELAKPSRTPNAWWESYRCGYDNLNATLLRQHQGGLVNLLQYSDAIPMAHSIESRLPFMDYMIVEFGFRIPGTYKYRDGFGKKILRDALRGHLSEDQLTNRIKRGFDIPLTEWFRESPDEVIRPLLDSPACRARGLFNHKQMWKAIDAHCAGRIEIASQIFRWMMTEAWFQTFID